MQIPSAIITLILGMLLVLGGLWIGQNVNLLPISASSNAPIYDELFQVLFTIGTILFVGIIGLLVYSLVRYRRRSDQLGDGLAIEGNLPLEIFWTAVPAVVVLFVGLYSYDIYDRMGGMVPLVHEGMSHQAMGDTTDQRIWGGISSAAVDGDVAPLPIEVTAMQFAFLFHYPEGDIMAGELHVPANRPVTLRMEAKDVIHAFWVPEFRIKQDVIPGQPTQLSFTATRPGSYPIVCAELCGPYHGGMRSTVVVDEPETWEAWFQNNAKAEATTT